MHTFLSLSLPLQWTLYLHMPLVGQGFTATISYLEIVTMACWLAHAPEYFPGVTGYGPQVASGVPRHGVASFQQCGYRRPPCIHLDLLRKLSSTPETFHSLQKCDTGMRQFRSDLSHALTN